DQAARGDRRRRAAHAVPRAAQSRPAAGPGARDLRRAGDQAPGARARRRPRDRLRDPGLRRPARHRRRRLAPVLTRARPEGPAMTVPADSSPAEPLLSVDTALHGTAVLGDRVLPGALVLLREGRIAYAGPAHGAPAHRAVEEVRHEGLLLPG